MNRQMLNVIMSIIIETLDEAGTDCAESTIYMAIGSDINLYSEVKSILVGAGIISISFHRCSLTEKGKQLAQKIRDAKSAVA